MRLLCLHDDLCCSVLSCAAPLSYVLRFCVQIRMPDNLYEMVVEVQEQVVLPLGVEPTQRNGPNPQANAEYADAVGLLVCGFNVWLRHLVCGALSAAAA